MPKATGTLDFGFSKITVLEDVLDEEPREGVAKHSVPEGEEAPYAITTLKLNNNALTSLEGMADFLPRLLWEPSQLSMIDLSFNGFTTVPEELEQLPNLS